MEKEFCSNCGAEVAKTDNYCNHCGAFVDGNATSDKKSDTSAATDNSPIPVQALPKQALKSKTQYISRRNLPLDSYIFFFFSFFGKSLLIFFLCMAGAVLQPRPFVLMPIVYFVVLAIISMLIYNNFLYEIDEDGLKIDSGVIHKLQVSVPYEQIQNVNIERTITDRLLGFARISIETAGSAAGAGNAEAGIFRSRSEAYIPGLHVDQANIIHDLLIDGADGNLED